jgi:hypothetical protein
VSATEGLAEGVFLQRHPLTLAGCRMGRNVTIVRLAGDQLLVHSTARFSEFDRHAIEALGEPAWLMEATNFHDTQAEAGRAVFADLPYYAPPGFSAADKTNAQSLESPPEAWQAECEIVELGGMPKIREHVVFHRPSKTLIVADLFFNLPPTIDWWTRSFLRAFSGLKRYPGTSRLFKFYIEDRQAFQDSLKQVATWDFERIVVAHGEPVVEDAQAVFRQTMSAAGFEITD